MGHFIKVSNLMNGDVLSYQIAIIKGSITSQYCTKNEKYIFINNEPNAVSKNYTFKCIVRMEEGINIISLNYCCKQQLFKLNYKVPSNCKRYITPLYIIFNGFDGSFQAPDGQTNDVPSALNKIHLNVQLVQTILAEKLFESHQKHLTFHLTEAKTFKSNISLEESHALKPKQLFHKIACEIGRSQLGNANAKYIAFLSGTRYVGALYKEGMNYEELVNITKQYVALGRGGLALFHTACLYTWPEKFEDVVKAFINTTPINREKFLDDSNNRGTFGTCYSTSLGSLLHEVCHIFNLGHANMGIMRRGFDDIQDIFLEDKPEALDADKRTGSHGITDSTKLHSSGAQILRYHKWILPEESNSSFILTFDPNHKIIKSTWGIRVIEIRSGVEELVTQNWVYSIARMSVNLNNLELNEKSKIFIQDSKGNWISHDLN